ncbi:hypothetical protein PDPUS_1_00567 [Photobacterium damselae subsp. piscicida]|uniref:Uncharacterized protein n=2 Tax=Photobacterium damsela subsp. piscicida TaxID=38294 RepID=A0A1V1V8N7_PHODP|nr:hypothetical protein [Photobacterium damselae]MBE8126905.1 hypothetical protein [Photobacterium damselae subsp. piscicida]MBE8130084.1 hypothetical protein [Photobacterium damselae subsp. piscicida]MDP2514006.1 hypothetical protein [Photobacterium damselae subsp. piscicida]MDP2515448.1 hypothetical protein [Photobacterium damselae subsp. piscicida]MDP2515938.1 hypothetical protein [Photobacterium damselae subsp. piscicida]
MENETIMKALFAQQRFQILSNGASSDFLSDAYIYAWQVGVYPLMQSGDDSVPDLPHEPLKDFFITDEDTVSKVISYLDDRWLNDNSPTFYELETAFGGKSFRVPLLHICKYAYLQGMFDDKLWDALLTKMEHPSEAQSIKRSFNRDEIYL